MRMTIASTPLTPRLECALPASPKQLKEWADTTLDNFRSSVNLPDMQGAVARVKSQVGLVSSEPARVTKHQLVVQNGETGRLVCLPGLPGMVGPVVLALNADRSRQAFQCGPEGIREIPCVSHKQWVSVQSEGSTLSLNPRHLNLKISNGPVSVSVSQGKSGWSEVSVGGYPFHHSVVKKDGEHWVSTPSHPQAVV